MERRSLPRLPRKWRAAGLAIVIAVVCACPTGAHTPESQVVRDAVARAVKFLETPPSNDAVGGVTDTRPGAKAVAGIALLKNGARASHPVVVSAVASLQRSIDRAEDPTRLGFDIYSASLATIFFVTLDPDRYRVEINALLRYLGSRQKENGAWGYEDRDTGDTSMTQNALLAYWEADKAKFSVPYDVIDRALVWLLKTRDPSGGFGYQGQESKDFTPARQSMVKPSMSGAGLGSLYICADLLRIGKPPEKKENLTPGMRKVEPKRAQPKSRIAPQLVQQALAQGKAWMEKNFVVEQIDYQLYNLYTVERYHTFREKAEGKEEKEPRWYDDGVRYLLKNQANDGSWKDGCQVTPATAFGILFLIRSTKISVGQKETLGDGTLVGGRGLPKHMAGLTVVDGNLVSKPKLASLDLALKALEGGTAPDAAEALEALAQLPSDEAEDLAAKHAQMLRELMRAEAPEVRLAAVRSLGKRRDLDSVPALLFALSTDPDPVVVRAARDSLRRISRKFDGFGMPDEPDEIEKRAAIKKWREWYLAIRPDAELED